jgi:hypothetical protein
MKNAMEKLKSVHKEAFKNVSNITTVAGRSIWAHKETILREM